MSSTLLPISEIFYSLQGEGARTGTANIFIRIQGCKAKNACFAMGIKCDTEFTSGTDKTLPELLEMIHSYSTTCKNIVWTGGEPADRITDEVVDFFHEAGYYQCIETSGLFPVAKDLDFVSVSPKVAEHVVQKNFNKNGKPGKDATHPRIDELRYVRHDGQSIPVPDMEADYYFVSPHFDGYDPNWDNIGHCQKLILSNPAWRLSVQDHKLWNVL